MSDQQLMRECFRLALRGKGHVSPNPMVGAVLARNGKVIAKGYHRHYGGPHAEVECLRRAPQDVGGTTLYVNLEPCSHYGKTPPCVDLILKRGIRKVVVSMEDPNPLVAGRGLRILRRSGVKTSVGLLEKEARELNREFITQITARRPYVHMKIAESRDGRITGGPSRWISSLQSRKRAHALRARYDAVLVGAGTVRADNPSLNVRLVHGRDPDVVVLDGALALPLNRKLFAFHQSRRVFVVTTRGSVRRNVAKARALAGRGIRLMALDGAEQRLDLRDVLTALRKQNLGSILVEGGADIFTQFLAASLVDELTLFVAPEVFGKGLAAVQSEIMKSMPGMLPAKVTVGKSGGDMLVNILF